MCRFYYKADAVSPLPGTPTHVFGNTPSPASIPNWDGRSPPASPAPVAKQDPDVIRQIQKRQLAEYDSLLMRVQAQAAKAQAVHAISSVPRV